MINDFQVELITTVLDFVSAERNVSAERKAGHIQVA